VNAVVLAVTVPAARLPSRAVLALFLLSKYASDPAPWVIETLHWFDPRTTAMEPSAELLVEAMPVPE
jgi:hypothetical protein